MKKKSLLFCSMCFVVLYSIGVTSTLCVVRSLNLNPQTTIIACDIDEVVISNRGRNYMKWLLKPSHWSFTLTVRKISKRYNLHDPVLIVNKIRELYQRKFLNNAASFQRVIGTARQKKKTIAILTELFNQGFTFVAASNMAKGTYHELLKNNVLPPELFSKDFNFLKTKKCNKKMNGSYYSKPDIEYYDNLKKYIKKKYPNNNFEYIVFIDDKKVNVNAARKAGLIAIHYKDSQQLLRCLEQIGIM